MILDKENLFSDKQQLLASAASINIIDLGATGTVIGSGTPLRRDLGHGVKIPLLVQVTEDFAGATALTIELQSSDSSGFSSNVKTLMSQTLPVAQLKAGSRWALGVFPYGATGRYLRINYTVDGTGTAGAITAGVTAGNDETIPYQ